MGRRWLGWVGWPGAREEQGISKGWEGVQSRWVANEDGERGQWTVIKEDARENK